MRLSCGSSPKNGTDVFAINLDDSGQTKHADGTGVRQLTDTRAFEWGPDWQPLIP